MTITISVPYVLRAECDGAAELRVSATTVRAALEEMERTQPKLYRCVCDETGAVRRHVNLFINSTLVRSSDRLDTALQPGDVLSIMPAVSGG